VSSTLEDIAGHAAQGALRGVSRFIWKDDRRWVGGGEEMRLP